MIELIFKIIDFCYKSLYFLLFICYTTGNIISIIGYYLFWGIYSSCSTIFVLIQIILEDFNSFGIDLCQILNALITYAIEKVETCFHYIGYLLLYVPSKVFEAFIYVLTSLHNAVLKYQSCLIFILSFIKQVLVNIGDGMWYAILIVPRTLNYVFMSILNELLTVYQATGQIAQYFCATLMYLSTQLYIELQEFDITRLIGLSLFIFVMYLFVRHQRPIRRFTKTILQSAINLCIWTLSIAYISCLQGLQKMVNWGNNRQILMELGQEPDAIDTNIPEAKLCIICRVLEKNIILYPCRHICMCRSCFVTLNDNRDNHCPVCRRQIKKIDRIFYT